ncbi:MAG: hypothetical protein V2B15_03565 [Bacteroidota bacterium]
MRVKYLVSDEWCCSQNGIWHLKGSIANLPDDIALENIKLKFIEPFSYSIPDQEIVRLYNNFIEPQTFESKVDIFIEAYSKIKAYAKEKIDVLLEDGTQLVFKLSPGSPSEWYYYNKGICNLYSKEFNFFKAENFLDEFKKNMTNYPYFEKRKETDLTDIEELIQTDDPEGLSYWYNEVIYGNVPSDEPELKEFLSKEIKFGIEVFLRSKAVAEYEGFLKSDRHRSKKQFHSKKEPITTLSEAFKEDSEYEEVMALLVSKDYCIENTHLWKREIKGKMKTLASLIKLLQLKGYYKVGLSNDEVKIIAQKTFNIDIGIDTIKHTKGSDTEHYFKFIPNSSSTK